MTSPLTTNQTDPRERTSEESFNKIDRQDASAEQTNQDESLNLEDEELTEDNIVDDDDNA